MTEQQLKRLRELANCQVCRDAEWVDKEWAQDRFGSDAEGEFVALASPENVAWLIDQLAAQPGPQPDGVGDVTGGNNPIGWISKSGLESLYRGYSPTIHRNQSGKFDTPIYLGSIIEYRNMKESFKSERAAGWNDCAESMRALLAKGV